MIGLTSPQVTLLKSITLRRNLLLIASFYLFAYFSVKMFIHNMHSHVDASLCTNKYEN